MVIQQEKTAIVEKEREEQEQEQTEEQRKYEYEKLKAEEAAQRAGGQAE